MKVLVEQDLTFDEEGNVMQELNDEVIEKIFDAFDEEYFLTSTYSDDLIELIKTKIIRSLKGNPRYFIQFTKETDTRKVRKPTRFSIGGYISYRFIY